MIYRLPKAARRALAAGLLVLALASFGFLVIQPLYAYVADIQERIAQERTMLGALTAATSGHVVMSKNELQAKAGLAAGVFLEGESEAIKLANLQSRLSEIIGANGIKLRSARNLPPRERYDLHLVGVELQLNAPIEQLQKILLTIEDQRPMLLVEAIQINPLVVSSTEERGMLDARLDVYGAGARK